MVWDSGDRFVCCWGESGTRSRPTFKLWTYRAYEDRHEFYEGDLARLVAMQYWSCVEYSGGTKERELPTYLGREWWERWRARVDDSDSDRRSPTRRRPSHPYRRPAKTTDGVGHESSDSSTSDSAPSGSSPTLHRYELQHRSGRIYDLDPHVNERLRRLESALMWHSNILERIVGCSHHACPHSEPSRAGRPSDMANRSDAAETDPRSRDRDLQETLNRLERVSGDIDRRLRTVHLCEGCA